LTAPDDLGAWLLDLGLAPATPALEARDLERAVALRDALRAALLAPDHAGLAEIAQGWLAGAPGALVVDRATLRARFAPSDHSCRCLLVPAVLDALDLAREMPGRVRECAAPGCGTLYLDTSRNRSRRWCSMERCGARSKAQTYYHRHRHGGP
jgi:predicted RNA-binding Zn ribbon-like protein